MYYDSTLIDIRNGDHALDSRPRSLLIAWALVVLCGDLAGAAQASGSWSMTGSMTSRRLGHSAALLPDGRALVAGGYFAGGSDSSVLNSSAELYDPATGTWSLTSPMPEPRIYFTLTLLPNGKVLAVGGTKIGVNIIDTDLYDPSSQTWTPSGRLNFGRYSHTATLLRNGKILVAGGADDETRLGLSSAELYDPATGTWTVTGSMAAARQAPTGTLLPNGKVLVAGGAIPYGGAMSSAELYDPDSGSWKPTGTLNTPRAFHTATLLANGKVLVAGGGDGSTGYYPPTAELYDPASESWMNTPPMNSGHFFHTATLLPNGNVLVVGGFDSATTVTRAAELYDPGTGMWSPTAPLNTQRRNHTATLLPNGSVLVAGGYDQSDAVILSSAEVYAAPAAGRISVISPANQSDMFMTQDDGRTATVPLQAAISGNLTGTKLVTWTLGLQFDDPVKPGYEFTDHFSQDAPSQGLPKNDCVDEPYQFRITGEGGTLTIKASAEVDGLMVESDPVAVHIGGYQAVPSTLVSFLKSLYGPLLVGMADQESHFTLYTQQLGQFGCADGQPGSPTCMYTPYATYKNGLPVAFGLLQIATGTHPNFDLFATYWDWQSNARAGASLFNDALSQVNLQVDAEANRIKALTAKSRWFPPYGTLPDLDKGSRENWAMLYYSGSYRWGFFNLYLPSQDATHTKWVWTQNQITDDAKAYINKSRSYAAKLTGDANVGGPTVR